jgi:NADH-quinone oxidoreductase subunit E
MMMEWGKIDEIIESYAGEKGVLIAVLQDIQQEFCYLPEEALRRVAERLKIPLTQVYGVATFFTSFSLKPRGRHLIHVCHGTACHVRGAERISEQIVKELAIHPGDTTPDREYTLEIVRCVGCCSLAPVMRIDETTYARMTPFRVPEILKLYREQK